MSLTHEERIAIVNYRAEKAIDTISEAKQILELNLYNLTANRLYYAAYYAATALMLSRGISSHTHKGAISLFQLNFVKPQIVPIEDGALLRRLFGMRHEGDYEDFIDFDYQDVAPLIPIVEDFVARMRSLTVMEFPDTPQSTVSVSE